MFREKKDKLEIQAMKLPEKKSIIHKQVNLFWRKKKVNQLLKYDTKKLIQLYFKDAKIEWRNWAGIELKAEIW